ncbi:diguanylate cyclase [Dietzia maris]
MTAPGRFWERFDTRSAAILVGSGGGLILPVFAVGSSDYVRPGMMPALFLVWAFGIGLFLYTARVGHLTDRQFATVGVGAMIAVAISASIVTDPAASRATVALLAAAPAISAMASTARVTLGFTVAAIFLASAFSIVWAASVVGALAAVGASILTVVIPVFLVVVLRSSLEFAMEKAALVGEIDPLTGALNRRGLTRRHARVFANCISGQRAVGFLLIDIDHFKAINDTFGHAAGDTVLVNAVRAIADAAPQDSLVSRIGGEEFVVMFPVASTADISAAASRIREAVAAEGEVTVSVGAVLAPIEVQLTGTPNASEVVDELTRLADRSAYRAKSLGRNRVVMQTSGAVPWTPGDTAEPQGIDHLRPTDFRLAALVRRDLLRPLHGRSEPRPVT